MTKGEVLIRAEGVSKKFCRNLKRSLWYGFTDIFFRLLGKAPSTELRKDEFWAVKEVSFDVRRGECLGLIGHNGAGKSTLLKMLNGLIRPDEGRIEIHGRVGALIELGAGFNPVLTGRENVYINGSVLGFTKEEIEKKYNDIVAFAELEEFMDMPVQSYSSGMKVRLGFAVASQMEPDVLIVDEVLAVGDLGFALKCFNKIDDMLKKAAVIFVSHNIPQVSRVSSKALMLDHGQLLYYANDVSKGIDLYYSKFSSDKKRKVIFNKNNEAELIEINLEAGLDSKEADSYFINRLDDLVINFTVRVNSDYDSPAVLIAIYDKELRGIGVCQSEKGLSDKYLLRKENGNNFYKVKVVIPRINLAKGVYSMSFAVHQEMNNKPLLRLNSVCEFQVISRQTAWLPIEFESAWS